MPLALPMDLPISRPDRIRRILRKYCHRRRSPGPCTNASRTRGFRSILRKVENWRTEWWTLQHLNLGPLACELWNRPFRPYQVVSISMRQVTRGQRILFVLARAEPVPAYTLSYREGAHSAFSILTIDFRRAQGPDWVFRKRELGQGACRALARFGATRGLMLAQPLRL